LAIQSGCDWILDAACSTGSGESVTESWLGMRQALECDSMIG
jgi:hypothetical protein